MDRIFHMMAETATAMADKDDEALLRLHAEGIQMLYHSHASGVSELVAILVEAMAWIEEASSPAPDSKHQPPPNDVPPNSVPLPAPEFVAVMPCGAFASVGSIRTRVGQDMSCRLLAAKSIADATVATMGRWEKTIANQLDKFDPVEPVAFLRAKREQVVTLLADPTRNRPGPTTPTDGDDELW